MDGSNKDKGASGTPDAADVGLDRNAYSNSRKLYEKTRDIRYAVIAIGRASGNRIGWPDGAPEWAVDACREFAEMVRLATPVERERLRGFRPELPQKRGYNDQYLKLIETMRTRNLSFAAACTELKIEDEAERKAMRRRYKDEFLDNAPPEVHGSRRIEEHGIGRAVTFRKSLRSQGQK